MDSGADILIVGHSTHEAERFVRLLGSHRVELAEARRTAIMCAEGDWRRCHRRLISDALVERGWWVLHIRPDGTLEGHQATVFS